MTSPTESVFVLSRALDQAGDVLAAVHEDRLADPTPCGDWDVATLIGHLVATPGNFLTMMRGDQPDWSKAPEPATTGWVAQFRSSADALHHAGPQPGASAAARPVAWQTAEIAVHTWDVARATGQRTDRLDPEVAEQGWAFVSKSLTDDNRGHAFGPAQPAPDDADAYDRLAAFSGRVVEGGRIPG